MSNIGFDFDGTLLNSKRRHVEVLLQAAKRIKVALPKELITEFVELKADGETGKAILARYNVDRVDDLILLWIKHIEEQSNLCFDVLYPKVCDYLNALNNKGHKLYLVTARNNTANAISQIDALNLNPYFKDIFVVCPSNGVSAGWLKAEVTSNYKLEYIIGDTEVDLEWSDIAGAKFYPVNYGFRSKVFWESKKVKSYNDLGEVIKCLLI